MLNAVIRFSLHYRGLIVVISVCLLDSVPRQETIGVDGLGSLQSRRRAT